MTAQLKYGIENEPVAAKTYSETTGNSEYLCGFVINPSAPYLGTSPGDWPKRNYTNRTTWNEISKQRLVKRVQLYLVANKNYSYKLRTSYSYFFQIIRQMALTGLKLCDVFVKYKQDFNMERISFEQDKWISIFYEVF